MSRIEDALAKLQAQHPNGVVTARRPIGRVVEPASHQIYGGKHIVIDAAALRTAGLLAPDSSERKLADEYRAIKRPLLENASTREPAIPRGNLLMVASAVAGEGKTFTCLNLCFSMARERDWRVVLVDGDCSKPHLTRLFGATQERGLIDLLRDKSLDFRSLVMPTDVPGFFLLPAGQQDEHAAELLASARMEALCNEVSSADPRRMVVFDSAPLLLTSESRVLASQVGQVVLVVRANHTPQRAVLEACEKLDPTKANSLVLNQTDSGSGLSSYTGYYPYGS